MTLYRLNLFLFFSSSSSTLPVVAFIRSDFPSNQALKQRKRAYTH